MEKAVITDFAIHQVRSAKHLLEQPAWEHIFPFDEISASRAADQIAPTRILVANIFQGIDTPQSEADRIWM